ncbi:MAG: 4-hydroxybenzoate octaprenyltransferase [Gammaproteobacteria bacterium]|jgi:4-hydroxybenzoate polyprenyltransferase|nr:4-hydroxybenzoate octaprenyltransferase [Gammaproteobacteria bacterium]
MHSNPQLQKVKQKLNLAQLKLWQLIQQRLPIIASKLPIYWDLTRMNRPIGFLLVLWPTLWCLWIAGNGMPELKLVIIFCIGTVIMRAAGCCMNDYADRDFDAHVTRTKYRPIATQKIKPREALLLCASLCLIAFMLVLMTNTLTILMAFAALGLTVIYPFMKRYTHLPQVVLGAAFSWGGLMAFTAQTGALPAQAWLLYIATLLWTIAFDTQYAMVDREDDLKIGVKSTAILFAEGDIFVIAFLQVFALVTLAFCANYFELGNLFQFGLLIAAGLFIYQHTLTWDRRPEQCFKAFLNNNWVGAVIFIFTVLDFLFR